MQQSYEVKKKKKLIKIFILLSGHIFLHDCGHPRWESLIKPNTKQVQTADIKHV